MGNKIAYESTSNESDVNPVLAAVYYWFMEVGMLLVEITFKFHSVPLDMRRGEVEEQKEEE